MSAERPYPLRQMHSVRVRISGHRARKYVHCHESLSVVQLLLHPPADGVEDHDSHNLYHGKERMRYSMDPVPAETLMQPPHDGTVANLLQRSTDLFPDRVALEHAGETVTYREFTNRVQRIAGGLSEYGLDPNDRIGVYLPNGIDFCATLWACVHAGIVVSPLNPQYRRREIEHQLSHSDAQAVVVGPSGAEHACPVVNDLGIDVIGAGLDTDTTLVGLTERGDTTTVERGDDDILLQPYTSGTTGQPKGVLLTHKNFRVQIVNSVASYTAGPVRGDALTVLPLYHVTGLLGMMSALCTGRTMHLLRPDQWDPDLVLETLAEHDVPAFIGVATMFTDLLEAYDPEQHDLTTLGRVGQGGDKLSEPVHERFEAEFDVAVSEGYGLTETTAATHAVRASTLGDRVGSVGQPIGHTRSKIIDEDGEEVSVGEKGELVLKGPQMMAGYYQDEVSTREAFTEDGYFRTGDIAYCDPDNYHYIVGREKEMILSAGYNVYPSEVERALYDHPAINETAVFGLADKRRGETIAAAVTLTEDTTLTVDEIKSYVLDELAPYKHPRVVEILDTLPKTGSGKVKKTILQKKFAEKYDRERPMDTEPESHTE